VKEQGSDFSLLHTISKLVNLKYLNFIVGPNDENTNLSFDHFTDLINLEKLTFCNALKSFTEITDGVSALQRLKSIELNHNQISSISPLIVC
jgi:Leucine-rich repeat (LRR) protein